MFFFQMSSCTVPVAPAPPALKDLPKVAGDLKSELEGFSSSKLKNAETQEKIVLPSAEGRKIIILFFLPLPLFYLIILLTM